MIQLPDNMLGKTAEDDPTPWALAPTQNCQMKHLPSGFGLAQTLLCGHMESKPVGRRFPLPFCLPLSLPFSFSLFKINFKVNKSFKKQINKHGNALLLQTPFPQSLS